MKEFDVTITETLEMNNFPFTQESYWICYFVIFDIIVSPCTILIEYCITIYKFISGVICCFCRKLRTVTGRICNVKIKYVLVVIKVCTFNRICIIDSVFFILIVDWKVCKMCFESPVRGSVHTCRSKCSLNSQIIFFALDIISNFL